MNKFRLMLIICGLSASSHALANPASVQCTNLGGITVNTDCQIDEWSLFFQRWLRKLHRNRIRDAWHLRDQ